MRYSKSSPLVGVTNASMLCCGDVAYLMTPSSAMIVLSEQNWGNHCTGIERTFNEPLGQKVSVVLKLRYKRLKVKLWMYRLKSKHMGFIIFWKCNRNAPEGTYWCLVECNKGATFCKKKKNTLTSHNVRLSCQWTPQNLVELNLSLSTLAILYKTSQIQQLLLPAILAPPLLLVLDACLGFFLIKRMWRF